MTSQPSFENTARLLIACPDRPGIVSAVSTFLYHHGANIIDLDQHSSDTEGGNFFMRLEFHTPHVDLSRDALAATFRNRVAEPYAMQWQISYADEPRRMAVLVSKHDHVLMELLWLARRGDLPAHASLVISNHETLRPQVNAFGIPFHYVPVTHESKAEAEQQILDLLEGQADLVVLARYMQILSGDFVARYRHRIINIHHSFLPAFAGANPYRQAYERGVKLIGATAHYVTEELDQGPIIEQQVVRVSHRHSALDLKGLGEEAERSVLCRAVKWHLQDRVIVDGNKTVVFIK
ncbi:MAG: formyltetrahydrofolate deformylase [Candidatus Competibacteraceae bacterium]|nr:formyltetrahydrofolate deformylase [Candidatus Competibacteraceae bacterium]